MALGDFSSAVVAGLGRLRMLVIGAGALRVGWVGNWQTSAGSWLGWPSANCSSAVVL